MPEIISAVLKAPLTGLKITSEECFKSLIEDVGLFTDPTGPENKECLVKALSKLLGMAIILGSMVVKLPQIVKILGSRDIRGLSFAGNLLELVALTIGASYSFRMDFPFSSYGENIFLSAQQMAICFLILWYGGRKSLGLSFTAVYAAVSGLLASGSVPIIWLWYAQMGNIFLGTFGKLLQVRSCWVNGHTGQLSAVTAVMVSAGSLVRVFTCITEIGDPTAIASSVVAASVNLLPLLQILYYWEATKKFLQEETDEKNASKKKD